MAGFSFLNSDQRIILADNVTLGYIGSLSNSLLNKLDLKNKKLRIAVVELNLYKLLENFSPRYNYQPLPQFPSVVRDLAFELDKNVSWQSLYDLAAKADKMVKRVEFLSLYDLGEKNSLAVRIEYAAKDRTLTSEEVAVVEKKIIKLVADKLKGNLRS